MVEASRDRDCVRSSPGSKPQASLQPAGPLRSERHPVPGVHAVDGRAVYLRGAAGDLHGPRHRGRLLQRPVRSSEYVSVHWLTRTALRMHSKHK